MIFTILKDKEEKSEVGLKAQILRKRNSKHEVNCMKCFLHINNLLHRQDLTDQWYNASYT